ncbi:DUF3298 and DUF4163 domain-containing protein [Pontibacter flavimaris]|uniref:DUF3298 domain-containing protein n=1 Tax=Pontibacter flavimaris TaxID=1797110 RepID=A0A1Q5PEC0_9BACT|nr:DUF3298 and DUF4163 domain-containing protein [Pontibacter flavimaris]OKL40511.1 hypothetical protein A3841_19685 [Pontibacter flavimaris]
MLKPTFYTLALAAAILTGCQSSAGEEAATRTHVQEQTAEQPLSFRSQTITRKSSYCSQGPEACAEATITYLEAMGGNEALRQSINQYVRQQILNLQLDNNPDADTTATDQLAAARVAEAFVKQQEDFLIAMEEIPASAAWWLKVKVMAAYQSSAVTTLTVSSSTYAGGAHPNTYLSLQSFGSNGQKLRLADLVLDTVQLQQLVEQEFRRIRDLEVGMPLVEAGLFVEGNALPLPRQAGLTPEGLRLYYNAYEVGPYVFGATDILLTYQQLDDLLRDKYKPD